jgi:all-trans-retinol dehydrogenase (NAD+)
MEKFKGKNVLITGGASGIGRLMGAMALDKGAATLIIWDINQENIDNTISEFSNKGKVIGHRVDVSNEQNVIDAAKTDAGNTSYCSF